MHRCRWSDTAAQAKSPTRDAPPDSSRPHRLEQFGAGVDDLLLVACSRDRRHTLPWLFATITEGDWVDPCTGLEDQSRMRFAGPRSQRDVVAASLTVTSAELPIELMACTEALNVRK